MFTWLLLPYAFLLTLTASGPVITGTLAGYADEPCPVIGAATGTRVGLTAICELPTLYFFSEEPTGAVNLSILLQIDPATMGGTWRLGDRSGQLSPQ